MQQGTEPSGNARAHVQRGSVTSGYMRVEGQHDPDLNRCVTTRTPGSTMVVLSGVPIDRRTLAEMLYLSAARFANSKQGPLYEPIIYGDKYPPMNFGIEYKDDKPANYIVEIAIAGIPKDEIQVLVDRTDRSIGIECGNVNVNADRPPEDPNRTQYLSRNIATRTFRKWLVAPERSDIEKISLEHKDGVLKIVIPIMEDDPNKILLKLQ